MNQHAVGMLECVSSNGSRSAGSCSADPSAKDDESMSRVPRTRSEDALEVSEENGRIWSPDESEVPTSTHGFGETSGREGFQIIEIAQINDG